jgi:predicted ATPase
MYKCIIDSGKVDVTPLTVLVGKNESGKTALLKALHKFNPFEPEPYIMEREWPRSLRRERSEDQIVCNAEFILNKQEIKSLRELTGQKIEFETIEITRDYAGKFEVLFPSDIALDKLHPNDVDRIIQALPEIPTKVASEFLDIASECVEDAKRLAREGRFTELKTLFAQIASKLEEVSSMPTQNQEYANEQQFIAQLNETLEQAIQNLEQEDSIHKKAHDYVIQSLPTFVYMDEFRAFQGTAMLDQLFERLERGLPTAEDKTILTILNLSALDLEELVDQGKADDREQRQYELDDGAATLTRQIEDNWGQLKYEVRFNADGQQFFTFVKDAKDRALIRLEERSRGFQWFFSFDLLLMHETKGSLKGCVILLDEPGLHLHPEGQRDLLKRLEAYAEGNTLIYTSHLPFMIDLQAPERIRVLTESDNGTVVTEDLNIPRAEGKLTLQAALGISGRTSFLLAERNLVVERVDDYWLITALSNLLKRSGEEGLPEDLMVTAAGGASEVHLYCNTNYWPGA